MRDERHCHIITSSPNSHNTLSTRKSYDRLIMSSSFLSFFFVRLFVRCWLQYFRTMFFHVIQSIYRKKIERKQYRKNGHRTRRTEQISIWTSAQVRNDDTKERNFCVSTCCVCVCVWCVRTHEPKNVFVYAQWRWWRMTNWAFIHLLRELHLFHLFVIWCLRCQFQNAISIFGCRWAYGAGTWGTEIGSVFHVEREK